MEIYKGTWSGVSQTGRTVVTVGTFDGVHLGHQLILKRLTDIAATNHLLSIVVTFDPHPQELFRDKKPEIRILTDVEEKTAIIEKMRVGKLVVIDFTQELAELLPRTFVEEVFVKRLNASHVVIGYDHAFGKDREGNQDNLKTLAPEFDYQVITIGPVDHNGVIISSTKIRQALYQGRVEIAKTYLGRPYSISGTVVSGDRRGRVLNIPTANLQPSHPKKLIPGDGVYSGIARIGMESYLAAISIGDRPTFDSGDRILEAHLINFEGDLYGKRMTLEFGTKLRDQVAFTTSQDLIKQMLSDIDQIKEMNAVQNKSV
jgi:riboflavin kinase/FMN adenylyltransferase